MCCDAHKALFASFCLCHALQEAARLMAAGDYESALPVSLEAVTIGEKLFKPQPALQLFPLYLLAAQVGTALPGAGVRTLEDTIQQFST